MAKPIRSRRISVAAGALSLALLTPSVVVPETASVSFLPAAAAQTVADFSQRYTTGNFWNVNEAAVDGLQLDPGTKVAPTTNTIFNWKFRNDNGTLMLIRPQSSTAFRTGDVDIRVKVTPQGGQSFTTTLKVNVVDEQPTDPTQPEAAPAGVDKQKFDDRYDTANFWNKKEAAVEGLQLDPRTKVEQDTLIKNWNFRNDGGALVAIRPATSIGFNKGDKDIAVNVTESNGATYKATLKLNIIDEAPDNADQGKFDQRYNTANFWNEKEAVVEGLQLDPGTKVEPTTDTIFNWKFRNDNGTLVLIRPQSSTAFETGEVDIPVKVTEANGNTYRPTLKVNVVDSRTPQKWEDDLNETYELDFEKTNQPKTIEGLTLPEGVTLEKAGITPPPGWKISSQNGKVVVTPPNSFSAGYLELPIRVNDGTDKFDAKLRIMAKNPKTEPKDVAGTAAGILGTLLGGILGGGTGGLGGILGSIGGLLGGGGGGGTGEGGGGAGRLINVVITNNAIASNNGNPSVVITNNANPTVNVEIKDNGSNNGSNNSAVVTGNANPVITGNANPTVEIKDNGSNNGSNNSAVVTGNANPVITGNANPTVEIKDNGSNNGSNNSAVVTGNANPVITGNANPVITDNANSSLGSSNGGGGITSPRCIVALAGLGLPLAALVPIALAQQVRIPGLEQLAAQAAEVFNNAAAQFNVQPEQITAVAGGAVGAVIALLAAVAVVSCIPGGAAPAAPAQPVEKAAPVVETNRPA
ncbi:hypothetical protein [Corynebacterium bouchesdurhonense]|uniref:hypothetical protein n=1 Tax=Corynebacterium bouchesdurhonense TaxID=1720192 RepID=UPI00082C07BC|nr:hypothetical protein [Corynebacterium bouchesdurhonense]